MFLWGKSGHGQLVINGQRRQLRAGDFVFLPWGHQILYEPDDLDPFLVGGIHVIPFQKRGKPVQFAVSHHPGAALAGSPLRKDVFWPALRGLISGTLNEGRLAWLASYIVDYFHDVGPDESPMRELGRLLVEELVLASKFTRSGGSPLPAELSRMREYATVHLRETVTVASLAKAGGCSVPSVHRLFRRFLETSPHKFVSRLRVDEARRLLRTTMFPISDIGARVGFEDPFHFSRFFKQQTGFPPSAYRRRFPVL